MEIYGVSCKKNTAAKIQLLGKLNKIDDFIRLCCLWEEKTTFI